MPVSLDKFFGIILYDIELDGRLNGVYSNIKPEDGIINNEICKPRNNDEDKLEGVYDCQWFDRDAFSHNGTLTITPRNRPGINVYDFEWLENTSSKSKFEGVGFKMNERQIAVSYWQTK